MKINILKDRSYLYKIGELEKRCFKNSYYKKEQLEEMFENSHYKLITAIENFEILGYIIAYDTFDIMEIMKIAVCPERRKENIAGLLFKRLLEETQLNIMLEVRESNIAAINFYEKMGMKKISLRKNYYSDNGENALIMLLERE